MEYNESSLNTILSIVTMYVVLGVIDSLYCRMAADDADSSGDISLADYDAFASTGLHRLFGPIHTIMKGVYAAVWAFEPAADESAG